MATVEAPSTRSQLTLDVGGDNEVELSTFKISGGLSTRHAELAKGTYAKVTITDREGEIIAVGKGWVSSVQFTEHRKDNEPTWTERIHAVKLETSD